MFLFHGYWPNLSYKPSCKATWQQEYFEGSDSVVTRKNQLNFFGGINQQWWLTIQDRIDFHPLSDILSDIFNWFEDPLMVVCSNFH